MAGLNTFKLLLIMQQIFSVEEEILGFSHSFLIKGQNSLICHEQNWLLYLCWRIGDVVRSMCEVRGRCDAWAVMTEPGCNYVTPLSCHSFPDVSCCLVIKMTVNYNSHQCITITVTTTLMTLCCLVFTILGTGTLCLCTFNIMAAVLSPFPLSCLITLQ